MLTSLVVYSSINCSKDQEFLFDLKVLTKGNMSSGAGCLVQYVTTLTRKGRIFPAVTASILLTC